MITDNKWYYTEKEFWFKVVDFIADRTEDIYLNADTLFRSKERIANYRRRYKGFLKDISNNFTSILYNDKLLSEGLALVSRDTADYFDISMEPDTPLEEISFRLILDAICNTNLICTALICKYNNNLTEEFLDNMIYITSGVFDFDTWDEEHVQLVIDTFENEKYKDPHTYRPFSKVYPDYEKKLFCKIDWNAITNIEERSPFSDEWLEKHKNMIKNNMRYSSR